MAVGAAQSGGGAARAIRCMPGDGLDIRVILSSGEAQRRWRGALEYPLPQFFPRLEVGNPFPCDGYRLTGLRIAGLAGRAVVDGETSEAADFDAVAMNQGSMHGPEDFGDGGLSIFLHELGKTLGETGDEFGAGHVDILPDHRSPKEAVRPHSQAIVRRPAGTGHCWLVPATIRNYLNIMQGHLLLAIEDGEGGAMILTDNETKVDLLNNEAIAATIISLLSAKPDQPVTIGVHGDWGAGKSSVLEMIEAGFAGKNDVLCLKFNGWRFQGFEDAKIALIEGIVTGLVAKRPALTKGAEAVKDVFRRIDWLKVAKRAGGLAVTAFTGIPTPDQVGAIIGSLESVLADPAKLASKENLSTAIDEVKAVLKPGETKNVPEEVEAFRKAFDKLLKDAGIAQLIVLIDDLDRCLPDTAIETLEAIRLFVFTDRTAFVVAADEAMIEYAVRKHFPDLPDSTGPRDYARNYLEKLIQVPFRIPALGETETRIYVTLLLAGAAIGENDAEYAKLIGVAREKLKRPWTSGGLDAVAVKAALGTQAEKANNALALSDQIGPILASGTKGNPRQIKRFLNTLLLRERTAVARGFGDDIKLPVLAKLMLAERFMPRLFEQIAFVAAVHWIKCFQIGGAPALASKSIYLESLCRSPGSSLVVSPRMLTECL